MSEANRRWRLAPPENLLWRRWGDEVVVRDDLSGSTHLLAPVASAVFCLLAEAHGGLTTHELALRLDFGIADPEPSSDAPVEMVLAELERIGLAWAALS